MKQAVLVVDVQPCFDPPSWLVERSRLLAAKFPSIATVIRHDEAKVPFFRQLGWKPRSIDDSLVQADKIVLKYGYGLPSDVIEQFQIWNVDRVLVCGIQADTCVLAAGFALFDAGLQPTIVADTVVGSSLDRSGKLGVDLWRHHFGQVVNNHLELL
ncbi:cysteine hydrolase family protein [Ruegeria atlantica]|uniref:cysteine hydrolase family protein n=1 Tax=Ruegeria atlantica TaxID=81569 RepID=UPI00147B2768|nr:cysteine hydrolase family protein [Ruegeria atlantica]